MATARAVFAAEGLLAARIYVLAAIVGGTLAIGSAKLGHPLFGFVVKPSDTEKSNVTAPPEYKPPGGAPVVVPQKEMGPVVDAPAIVADARPGASASTYLGAPIVDSNDVSIGRVERIDYEHKQIVVMAEAVKGLLSFPNNALKWDSFGGSLRGKIPYSILDIQRMVRTLPKSPNASATAAPLDVPVWEMPPR
jgi:hypothetical protein